jgi:hypothetical protein
MFHNNQSLEEEIDLIFDAGKSLFLLLKNHSCLKVKTHS